MPRAKRSIDRQTRSNRTLRLEALEQRALLSAAATVGTTPIQPVESDSAPVITLGAIHSTSNIWTLKGAVTDGNYPVAGLRVEFGGTLARFHLAATVQKDGTYSVTETLPNVVTGTASAQTRDSRGKASNVAMTYILNYQASRQANIAPLDRSPQGGSTLTAQSLQSIVAPQDPQSSDAPAGGEAVPTISTIAGASRYLGDGGLAVDASLYAPEGMALDSSGDLFIADTYNNVIREIDASTGTITTVAGSGICGYSGDGGAAANAQLNDPTAVAVDAAGNVFIADSGNDVIREVNQSTGVITTVAGNGIDGYSGDGAAAIGAELDFPCAVAVDALGHVFIADSGNDVVREVDLSTGLISTVAGNGTSGYSGDGAAATTAQLGYPTGVAVDAAGSLFIADRGNNVIRAVDLSTGVISTVAGNGTSGYSGDGAAAGSAQLSGPSGVAVDAAGNLFVADSGNNVVREVDLSTGLISTVAGNGSGGYSGDGGEATRAELNDPAAIAADSAGDLFLGDSLDNALREVDAATGLIHTIAGNGAGNDSGDGGAATSTELYDPLDVAADGAGNCFVADSSNNAIREVNLSTGVVTTVAGDGAWGYGGDGGAAASAQLNDPTGLAVDAAGDLFIADSGNNVVREVNLASGAISTVAGNGTWGYGGDGGAAASAQLNDPTGLAVDDATGDLFIADSGNNVIREVDLASGIISTIAGSVALGGGYGGDGGAATSAQLNDPAGLAIDGAGPLHRRHVQQRHPRGRPHYGRDLHGRRELRSRRRLRWRRRSGHQRRTELSGRRRG